MLLNILVRHIVEMLLNPCVELTILFMQCYELKFVWLGNSSPVFKFLTNKIYIPKQKE